MHIWGCHVHRVQACSRTRYFTVRKVQQTRTVSHPQNSLQSNPGGKCHGRFIVGKLAVNVTTARLREGKVRERMACQCNWKYKGRYNVLKHTHASTTTNNQQHTKMCHNNEWNIMLVSVKCKIKCNVNIHARQQQIKCTTRISMGMW